MLIPEWNLPSHPPLPKVELKISTSYHRELRKDALLYLTVYTTTLIKGKNEMVVNFVGL
jgi:hypothetical protein